MVRRNFTGKVIATKLTNTSSQYQCLQDIFAFIQLSNTHGIVLGWRCTAPRVSCLLISSFLYFIRLWITFSVVKQGAIYEGGFVISGTIKRYLRVINGEERRYRDITKTETNIVALLSEKIKISIT